MNLTLLRKQYRADGIFGELVDEKGNHVAVTLERSYDISGKFEPKIKAGIYECHRYLSPSHGYEVFLLKGDLDGDGFTADGRYFEIHIGNYNKDSDGCILVGLQIGFMTGGGQMITSSKQTFFDKLMPLQAGLDKFILTVQDQEIGELT